MSAILESFFDKFVRENHPANGRLASRGDGFAAYVVTEYLDKSFAIDEEIPPNELSPESWPKIHRMVVFVLGVYDVAREKLNSGESFDGSMIDSRLHGQFCITSIISDMDSGGNVATLMSDGVVSVDSSRKWL